MYICKKSKTSDTRGKYYVLTNDIKLNSVYTKEGLRSSSCQTLGINNSEGPFAGNFDGRGHTITGVVFDRNRSNGFFGDLEDAKISNVTFDYVGLVVPYDSFDYKYLYTLACNVKNTVINNVHIRNAYCFVAEYSTTVKAAQFVGGVVYKTLGNVIFNDCTSQVDVDKYVRSKGVGGLVFYNEGDLYINRCKVSGSWNGYMQNALGYDEYDFGGFVAYNYKGKTTINQCLSSIEINYKNGCNSNEDAIFGGLVGLHHSKADLLTIKESAFMGTLNFEIYKDPDAFNDPDMEDGMIGGFIGYCNEEAQISDCAFIGDINFNNTFDEESHYIGCLIGDVNDNVQINRCSIVSFNSSYSSISSEVDGRDPVAYYGSDVTLDNSGRIYYYVKSNGNMVSSSCVQNAANVPTLLTSDTYLSYLNASTRTVWGRYYNEESVYNGAPLPLACGGSMNDHKGSGTSEDPYLIETEADLRALSTESYSSTLEGKYFRLNADIIMSSEPFPAIGRDREKPFRGHFNGNGHCISRMVATNGSMFAYMCGVVENLALLDFSAAEGCTSVMPIAMAVGGNIPESTDYYTGVVTSCYASGDLWSFTDRTYSDFVNAKSTCAGLCGTVYDGSTLANSYFIGSLNTYIKEDSEKPFIVHNGICNYNNGDVNHCYAILSFNTLGATPNSYRPGLNYYTSESGSFTDNWFIALGEEKGYDSSMRVETYADLRSKFSGYGAYSSGAFNPVNRSAKYYSVEEPINGWAYIDATRPLFYDNMNTVVYIDKDKADARFWELPNVGIHDHDTQISTVPNYIIDPNYDYFFWRGVSSKYDVIHYAKEGNVTFPLTLNESGWYSLCLPCDLYLDDLPEGSKMRAVGQVSANTVRLIEVMYVPAGSPCVVYIPTENTGTYTLNLSGTLALEPKKISEYSSMVGVLQAATVSDVAVLALDGEGNPYFQYQSSATLSPFSGYIAGATDDIAITEVTGAFLDRSYRSNTYTVEMYDGQAPTIAVIGSYPVGQWSTLCLPFDLSVEQAQVLFGAGYEVEDFKYAIYGEGTDELTMYYGRLDMANKQCPLEAGKPYLIKPSQEYDSSQPLSGFTLSAATTRLRYDLETEKYGTMKIFIEPTFDYFDNPKWYMTYNGEDDNIKWSSAINGLGFYVNIETDKSGYYDTISICHETVSGVESVTEEPAEVVGIYDLSGRRLSAPQRGVNILRMSDGTARKVIINQ